MTSVLQETTGTLYVQADSQGTVDDPNRGDNISSGVEVCLASADAFESDDTPASATTINTDGVAQTHNLHTVGDEDWFVFTATAGVTYTVQTGDLGLSADTYLYLYDTEGTTLLASNDDYGGTLASQIEWTAQADGTYYVMVRHWNPNVGGCGTGYSVAVVTGICPDYADPPGVDIGDVQFVAAKWHQPAIGEPYDCDGDGGVTVVDIECVAKKLGNPCVGPAGAAAALLPVATQQPDGLNTD